MAIYRRNPSWPAKSAAGVAQKNGKWYDIWVKFRLERNEDDDPLVVPKAFIRGDTVALISISGGRAGDADMCGRHEIGKKRLEKIWGLRVQPTPNALAGSTYLYEHPEARAEERLVSSCWSLHLQFPFRNPRQRPTSDW